MGLFSKLRGGTAASADPVEAVARGVLTMPLLTAAADGSIDKTEVDEVIRLCSQSPIFWSVGGQRTSDMAVEIINDLKARGANAVFEDGAVALSPALRETALCFSIRVAIADGTVDNSEKETLAAMGERLQIPFETFTKIFEVLMMLHRPATA